VSVICVFGGGCRGGGNRVEAVKQGRQGGRFVIFVDTIRVLVDVAAGERLQSVMHVLVVSPCPFRDSDIIVCKEEM